MKTNKLISPRAWYWQNQAELNALGFTMSTGNGDNIGLSHDKIFNELDFYWDEDDNPGVWILSFLYDSEEELFEEVESYEQVFEVLKYVSQNIMLFESIEEK